MKTKKITAWILVDIRSGLPFSGLYQRKWIATKRALSIKELYGKSYKVVKVELTYKY